MKSNWILYRNELKNLSKGLIIIFLIMIGHIVLMSFFIKSHPRPLTFQMFLIRLSEMLQYLFSAFLVFSMYREKRRDILDDVLSHPKERHLILRNKFLVLLSATILWIALLGVYAFTYNYFRPRADNIVIVSGLIRYFSLSFISLCLVTAAWGITQLFKRFRLRRNF